MVKLLIVDDNEQNRYLLKTLLTGHGYDVTVAVNGIEALELAWGRPPDLIITDVLMPGMDGYTLCRQWKNDARLNAIPFVFYTATYTDPKDQRLGLEMGAERFILKPQEPEALLEIIEEIVAEHQSGLFSPPQAPAIEETAYLRGYNDAIVRKLEEKLEELEAAKAALEWEVAERKLVEKRLALEARRMQALLDLQLLSEADEEAVLNFALDACLRITESDYSFLGTLNDTGDVLHIQRWSKEVMAQCAIPDRVVVFSVGAEGLFGECVRRRAPIVCNDYEAASWSKKGLPEGHVPIRRFAMVPVLEGDRVTAVAAVANKKEDYRDADMAGLSTLLHKVWEILSRRRREQERNYLEKQYRQAQKMEAIGLLAGGMAHDFNNILQAIIGFGELLTDNLPREEEPYEYAEGIVRCVQHAATLTHQLLSLSRRQILEMEDLNLNEVVSGFMKMIRRLIGEDIEMEVTLDEGVGAVHADRGQMEQILLNLCLNARDAMPRGGVLSLATADVTLDEAFCAQHVWAAPGRYVRMGVVDTGAGMDADTLARIYDPFFTTKEPGRGTGLGLATVYGIVKQHEGLIQVESKMGTGTTFTIYLPVFASLPREVVETAPERAKGGHEGILLAEDDTTIREMLVRILGKAGYTVYAAANGAEAVELFASHADTIALAVLDTVMPKMNGLAAFEAIRAAAPRMGVLFSSGYSVDTMEIQAILGEDVQQIQKPFAPQVFLRKVREMLDLGLFGPFTKTRA